MTRMNLFALIFALGAISQVHAWDAKKEYDTNCAVCHTIGGGDKLGPDLAGLSERRDEKWLIKYIQYPMGMMEGDEEEPGYETPDPIAVKLWEAYKPNIMAEQNLTDDQVKALLAHIKKLSEGKEPQGKVVDIK